MSKPYVVLNSAMTLDGKISSISDDSGISCEEDLDRVHELRASVDAVMVGIGTVLVDDPKLTVRRVDGDDPVRVVVDSKAKTPSRANVLNDSAPTIVAVSSDVEEQEVERIQSSGGEVIVAGEDKVDLDSLLNVLSEKGIEKVLLEGGSTLNWGMLNQGLVDEVKVAVCPCLVGGEQAKTLVGGEGVEKISEGFNLELVRTKRVGRDLLLVYRTE